MPLLVVDQDAYTGPLLAADLRERGFDAPALAPSVVALPDHLAVAPDVVVLNFHLDRPDVLAATAVVKQAAPEVPVIVLASPGPAQREVEAWSLRSRTVDLICRKPLDERGFFGPLRSLLVRREAERGLEQRSARLAARLPEPARDTREGAFARPQLEEAAVLVTDVRNSSGHIWNTPAEAYFAKLNRSLSDQAELVRANGGTVIKFLGDGMLAAFTGPGRHHLALRCALALAEYDERSREHSALRCGIGGAEGLVLSGYLGEREHLHFDIIGATVHLAARLCGLAAAGQALVTRRLYRAARLELPEARELEPLAVRGMEKPVPAVAIAAHR